MQGCKIREVMTRNVRWTEPTEDLELALQRMLWGGFRHLPVLSDGRVVGVLSHRDVLDRFAKRNEAMAAGHPSRRQTVADAMHVPVETVSPEDTVGIAARKMSTQHIGCLPVVDEAKHLVGIVTSGDVLAEYGMSESVREVSEAPTVASAMTRDPLTVNIEATLTEVVRKLLERNVRHLPVVDAENRLLGIVSDRDVRAVVGVPSEAWGDERLDDRGVAEIMSVEPITVRADEPLLKAVSRFVDERVGALPVVDPKGRLVGILSYLDVLRFLRGSRIWGDTVEEARRL